MQVVEASNDADPVQPPVHGMGFFFDCVGNFMADLLDKGDWTEQPDYICALCKPKAMTPTQFLSQLWHLCIDACIISTSASKHLNRRQTEAHLPL
jgi:hypothetical protein